MNNKYSFQNKNFLEKYDKYKKKYMELKNKNKINENILNKIGSSRKDIDNVNKIFNTFIEGSKKGKNDLKMVLGAGNIDMHTKLYDYTRYHNLYDIVVTNNDYIINDIITEPVALNIDFNNIEQLEYLQNLLNGRFSKIILDINTNKFVNWNSDILKLLYGLLNKNGELYIDIRTYTKDVLSTNDIMDHYAGTHYFPMLENYVLEPLLSLNPNKKEKHVLDLKPNIFCTNSISYRNDNNEIDIIVMDDFLRHNIILLGNCGFKSAKFKNSSKKEPYPLYIDEINSSNSHNETTDSLVFRVEYIMATK